MGCLLDQALKIFVCAKAFPFAITKLPTDQIEPCAIHSQCR